MKQHQQSQPSSDQSAQSAILASTGTHGMFLTLYAKEDEASMQEIIRFFAKEAPKDSHSTIAFGYAFWGRLAKATPSGFKIFEAIKGGKLHAPATGGDVFIHLHGAHYSAQFEYALKLAKKLAPYCQKIEEWQGFRYQDSRDFTGFIDGTANPKGEERPEAALITEQGFEAGSFLFVQRYEHHLTHWEQLKEQEQEAVIGRKKADSTVIPRAERAKNAHIVRAEVERNGEEVPIVRHSMPYGQASGTKGLIFLAYTNDLSVIETMLAQIYGTTEDGIHDHLMEFTQAKTGAYFFAPSKAMLEGLAV